MRRVAPRHTTARKGILYVVGTPIGNKDDITLRCLKVLRSADVIAAEDTRKTKALLHMHDIKSPKMVSFSEHSPRSRLTSLVDAVREGQQVAFVTDAGTPAVSDPGSALVSACAGVGLSVVPIPGVSAVTAALSVSGHSSPFLFAGFLPRKRLALVALLKQHLEAPHSLIFFESPHRIVASLKTIAEVLGKDRKVVMAREISKLFEEILHKDIGSLIELLTERAKAGRVKGEFTVVIGPSQESKKKKKNRRKEQDDEEDE